MAEKLPEGELKKAYDEWHERSGQVKLDVERKFYNRIIKLLQLKPRSRVLDVGCGKGVFLSLAEEKGLVASGIDISQKAVQMARKLAPSSEIDVGMAEKLPWQDNYFDYVTCFGSLEHFLDPEKALKEMARVLRPEGLCCLLLPNSYFIGHIYMALRYGIPPDESGQTFSERFGTRREWQNMIARNGLEVLRIYKFNTGLWSTTKVGLISKLFYNFIIRPLLPLNLSAQFVFICQKEPA